MEKKEDELKKLILNATPFEELPKRLSSHVSEEGYKNRILLLCFERQIRYGKIVKLVIKDEQKYYQMLENESRQKMRIFPYHIQVCEQKIFLGSAGNFKKLLDFRTSSFWPYHDNQIFLRRQAVRL